MKSSDFLASADSFVHAEIQIEQLLSDIVQKHWEDQTMKHMPSYIV